MTGTESRRKRPTVGVVAILLFAAAVRLTNLAWDQTHFFHPDERAVASAVLRVSFRPLQLNPQFFAYGSLPIYLAKITSSVAATVDQWAAGYDGVILNGRRMSAVIGTLTVLVLIGVGRRLYGDAVGLLAGLLLAACALHVQNSRFLTVDVSLTFFVLLALAEFVRVSAEGRWRDFVCAGIAVGCAVATLGAHSRIGHFSDGKVTNDVLRDPAAPKALFIWCPGRKTDRLVAQQGYFTAKQASDVGYQLGSQAHHVKSGNWVRVERGIYRLARFPQSNEEQLVMYTLWSRNRAGEPQGVYSHQTALSIHELSDVNPAKLHMTVPSKFRRSAQIPQSLVLHRAMLDKKDVEHRQGFAVTRPLQAIVS